MQNGDYPFNRIAMHTHNADDLYHTTVGQNIIDMVLCPDFTSKRRVRVL